MLAQFQIIFVVIQITVGRFHRPRFVDFVAHSVIDDADAVDERRAEDGTLP